MTLDDRDAVEVDASAYCREVETYLCRKNEGHLIRIVGPAFDQVCGWARRGVPLKVVFSGIDRYVARYYAKGPRRRPVRIEFCEADVLDVFDEWRRAVGMVRERGPEPGPKRQSLHAHVNRAIVKLTSLQIGTEDASAGNFGAAVGRVVEELNGLADEATRSRGEARARLIAALSRLDRELLDAARANLGPADLAQIDAAASGELAPFAERMEPAQHQRALAALGDRLIRERFRLPVVSYLRD